MQEYSSAKSDMKELYQIRKIMRNIWVRRWSGRKKPTPLSTIDAYQQ